MHPTVRGIGNPCQTTPDSFRLTCTVLATISRDHLSFLVIPLGILPAREITGHFQVVCDGDEGLVVVSRQPVSVFVCQKWSANGHAANSCCRAGEKLAAVDQVFMRYGLAPVKHCHCGDHTA